MIENGLFMEQGIPANESLRGDVPLLFNLQDQWLPTMNESRKQTLGYKAAVSACTILQKAGFEAYLVGGTARDIVLGRPCPEDADVATSAEPAEFREILEKNGFMMESFGERWGSLTGHFHGGRIEITSFRTEGRYSDKRHPDRVQFIKDYRQDALRRDFTINALYLDPLTGSVMDPVSGLKDLRSRLIRLIGDPKKRIDEDHLRMLRAVRFTSQLDFKMEKNTFAAIKTRAKLIATVTGPRIKAELDKLLPGKNVMLGMRLLDETGLLRFILPELECLKNIRHKSKRYHLEGDVYKHSLMALSEVADSRDLDLSYAALLHDIGKATTGTEHQSPEGKIVRFKGHDSESVRLFGVIAKRLGFPRKQARTTAWLIAGNRFWPDFADLPDQRKIDLVLHPSFPQLAKLWQADANANLNLYPDGSIGPYRTTSPRDGMKLRKRAERRKNLLDKFCDGKYLLALTRRKPGTDLGNLIRQIRIAVVRGDITTEPQLKTFLKKNIKTT